MCFRRYRTGYRQPNRKGQRLLEIFSEVHLLKLRAVVVARKWAPAFAGVTEVLLGLAGMFAAMMVVFEREVQPALSPG